MIRYCRVLIILQEGAVLTNSKNSSRLPEGLVLPVLLGTDMNAYGMARAFHEAYGLRSLCVGKGRLIFTEHSRIVDIRTVDDFDKDDVFLPALLSIAKILKEQYQHLILLAPDDHYAKLAIIHRDMLGEFFHLPFVSQDLLPSLLLKDRFYELCETHGLDFPKTVVVTRESFEKPCELPFPFPVFVKPANSTTYMKLRFEGMKKAYFVPDEETLMDVLRMVYRQDYHDPMLIQDYIPGADSNGLVVNAYCDREARVRLISIGNPLLEDPTPMFIGNYTVIRDTKQPEVAAKVISFLEAIGYTGFANLDLKFDPRDQVYKVFELNLRQGRSSSYTLLDGCNLGQALVDDFVLNKPFERREGSGKGFIWLAIPKELAVQFTEDPDERAHVEAMLKAGRVETVYRYAADRNFRRWLTFRRYDSMLTHRFKQFFVSKQVEESGNE